MAENPLKPPPGFVLESAPPPEGFVLEGQQSMADRAKQLLRNSASEFMRGTMGGGPHVGLGRAVVSGLPELMELQDQAIAHGAYQAGGYVTDKASQVGLPPQLAGGLGYAANVATQAVPAFVGGELSKPLTAGPAKWMMRSALKADVKSRMTGKADRAVNTLLKEGVNATQGGADDLQRMITDLNRKVDTLIAGSNKSIDKNKTVNYLQDVIEKFRFRPNALEAQDDVLKAWTQFVNHPEISGQSQIPIQTAQRLKQGYQRSVGDKGYGELKTVATEAEKTLARALRTEIAALEPTVGPALKRESDLINALKLVSKRASAEQNNNPLGFAALAPNPSAFIAMLADKWGLTKSVVARALYSGNAARAGIVGAEVYLGTGSRPQGE